MWEVTWYYAFSDCGDPLNITNGVTFKANATVGYVCEAGYVLIGNNTITCGVNGKWVGDFPACQTVGM